MSYNPCWFRLDDTPPWKAGGPLSTLPQGQAPAVPSVTDVLLVEDDALVRETLGKALGDAGWWVGEAADAAEALDRMTFDGMPGVLVTGLVLGRGMSGLALVAAARLRWPHLPAVMISGTDMAEPALGPGDRFLRKPFDDDILTRAVSDLAGRQGMVDFGHAAA